MQTYNEGDDIYMFGFSRGAYIARFLAQMLDSVGLLNQGNEEMFRFAWKAFAQWQTRLEETEEQKKKKKENYEFMKAFRETFSRPVRRIRFIGLFDTVNSVPKFENNWMKRAKYPYTAKSSAKVIRHAVSIDERRAKFRQNLISQKKDPQRTDEHHLLQGYHHHDHHHHHSLHPEKARQQGPKKSRQIQRQPTGLGRFEPRRQSLMPPSGPRSRLSSKSSLTSVNSITMTHDRPEGDEELDDDDEAAEQNVEEVWFPGKQPLTCEDIAVPKKLMQENRLPRGYWRRLAPDSERDCLS